MGYKMGGGLMQLVAYGAQDIYLTGNPQITFFKVVYRRHTNFSMESIEQTFNGAADFGKRVTCTVSLNGDLMHRVYLQVTVPALTNTDSTDSTSPGWVDWLGHALIKNVEVEIGGQRVDKHYGDWMHIWNELTQSAGKKDGYGTMVGETVDGKTDLYIPLEFWFCRNPGLALPLIALQYHEVKINLEFRSASECMSVAASSTPSLLAASLYVDYIYLDTDERRRFAQVSHEYLIEQLQFTGDESISTDTTVSPNASASTSTMSNLTDTTPMSPRMVSTSTPSVLSPKNTSHLAHATCPALTTPPFSSPPPPPLSPAIPMPRSVFTPPTTTFSASCLVWVG